MGLFTPLGMSIFTRVGEKRLNLSLMDVAGISKVTGIPVDNADLVKYINEVYATLEKSFPNGRFEKVNYDIDPLEGEIVNRFSMTLDLEDSDVGDELDGIQGELEAGLKTAGFVIAGFTSLENDAYDLFDVYSICKISVFFEVSKNYPEAGAFAPCPFYIYKKKGEDVVHLAYPSVYNWFSSLDIASETSRDVLIKAQQDFNAVVEEATED